MDKNYPNRTEHTFPFMSTSNYTTRCALDWSPRIDVTILPILQRGEQGWEAVQRLAQGHPTTTRREEDLKRGGRPPQLELLSPGAVPPVRPQHNPGRQQDTRGRFRRPHHAGCASKAQQLGKRSPGD